MTTTLQQALLHYADRTGERQVLDALSYRTDHKRARDRLRKVIEDPELGLSPISTAFDWLYSSKAFIYALARQAELDERWVEAELERIEEEIETQQARFKSYLWVDTLFKRDNQPIFVLATCERSRYIRLNEVISHWPHEQQLAHAAPIVRKHYAESEGMLAIWGKIQSYRYYHGPEQAVVLGPDGKSIGSVSGPVPNQARLRLA